MTSSLLGSLAARGLAALAFGLLVVAPAPAQRSLTAADYSRAERAMIAPAAVTQLANSGRVTPNWLPGDRFWYATTTPAGTQFTLVDPARKSKAQAFDHAKVAVAISAAAGKTYDAMHLPFTAFAYSKDSKSILVNVDGKDWSCGVNGAKCVAAPAGSAPAAPAAGGGRGGRGGGGGRGGRGGGGATSPDGKLAAFIKDYNLWVRDVATNRETQLTTDGVPDFGYATDNAGWTNSTNAVVLWSPDSKKIATQQQDERGVGDMYIVTTPTGGANGTIGGHPVLRAWHYPLPGDSIITTIQRVIIDVASHKVTRLQMAPDQHRSIQGDNLSMSDVKWSPDGSRIDFASVSREHKHVWIREANVATGAVRTIMEETSPTHVEDWVGWRVLWPTNEILWYSQRDNFGHLYLYDLATGKLKNQVTSGEGNVTAINRLNDTTRVLWYTALGGEKGQNPYFAHHYRVNLDGTKQVSLDPDDGNHETPANSPSGKYFVDVWSQNDVPYASSVRDGTTGAMVMALEKPADAAAMKAAGWNPVTTIRMKARDGVTEIYGQMEKPSNFDPNRKYPIINYIYPGPQTGSVGGWGFKATQGESSGLSELGFIVVAINGMGTPGRDKKFMDAYYGRMGDNTLPDQVAGMKELAQRFAWIDIDKVGIWGHSGGGFATADAMFRYPDFFKVGIAESGNHDNREYEDDWGERYQGLLARKGDSTNYDAEANQNFAANLKGHLLLAHGTMDNNVPPYNTLLIVDKLIAANKDFDLVLFPNAGHGYGSGSAYMQRRRWDYFTRWLLNAEPPKEFEMGGGRGGAGGRGAGGRGGQAAPPAGRGGGGVN